LDTGFIAITLLAFGFVGWYGAGSLFNRYKSKKMLKTVAQHLKKYRGSKEVTPLGSSGFIIDMDKPTDKIKKLSLGIVLSKRELPINWIVDYIRGKRDTLTIKAVFNKKPGYDADIYRLDNYYGKILHKKVAKDRYRELGGVYLYPGDAIKKGKVKNAVRFMEREKGVWWISLKREGVHLIITANPRVVDNLGSIMRLIEDLS
jgi:hypothetical protein